MKKHKDIVEKFLNIAGITINGDKPWDIKINNENFYKRIIHDGELGLGESYMDGWWDSPNPDQMLTRLLRANIQDKVKENFSTVLWVLFSKIFNYQSYGRAKIVGKKHYDIGNKLYQLMLDKRMNYSCAYWKDAENLDKAQENKLDMICKKLQLEEGMEVLDLGCGWGAFGKFAYEKYGVKTTGITISKQQKILGEELCKDIPVTFHLTDYRKIKGKYDRIVSVGMMEHVGYKNYKSYFNAINNNLKDNGIALIQTIGSNRSVTTTSAWFDKYIFPNGMLPSIKQIGGATEKQFVIEDWHNFGHYYDYTLLEWFKNFTNNWDKLKSDYDDRFFRMWTYYLLSSAASFRSRYNQLWQIVITKKGIQGGYTLYR